MKRKILSIVLALVLMLTLSFVTAVPAGAATTFTREGSTISVVSEHLCELSGETADAFNNEPETLVLDGVAFDAQTCSQVTIEGEVSDLTLGAGWVDTAYIEIGLRPEATMNARNAGVYLIALNAPAETQVHLQDYTGGGRSGGVIKITKDADFRYKIRLETSGSTGGTANLEVWVGDVSQGTATLTYGYASTWVENVAGAFDEDFSDAHLFYSIIADRRGAADQTYSATVGDITIDDTLYVGAVKQFSTIQEAIDFANPGDTINVAAGSYPEDVTVDKTLTLEGAQAGVDARGRTGDESEIVGVVVVTSDAANVTIDGFTLTSPTRSFNPRGFNLGVESESSTIRNNILVAEENEGHVPYGSYLTFQDITNALVEQNSFSGHLDLKQCPNVILFYGIAASGVVTVQNNEMRDVGGGGGIGVMCGNADVVVNIDGNEIENTGNECIWVWSGGGSAFDTLSITSNDLSEATLNGIKFVAPITGVVSVSGNEFRDNPVQILDSAEVLDIQQVLDTNTFDRAVVVDHTGTSLLHTIWSNIQDGVDAAVDGDTVTVAAGQYDEYVNIGIPLTLLGKSGAIVKPTTSNDWPIIGINADGVTVEGFEVDGTGLTPEVWAGIGSWSGCTGVTIKGNTVHDIANSVDSGLGIGLWRSGVDIYEDILIEGNTIYNTDRMGIYIGSWSGSAWLLSDNITIRDNDVYDTMIKPNDGETFPGGCGGIAIDAAKNCTIEGNTVYDTANTMPGIFLAHGSGAGNQIYGNEVYNQAYGIAVEIDRGMGDVDFGEDLPAAPGIHFNNIHDNGEYGLIVLNAAEKEVDATNNWWGTKASGLIKNMVSDNVDYDPWIGAKTKASKSKKTAEGDDIVEAKDKTDTEVVKKGSGTPTITVTEYTDNPGDGTPGGFSSAGDKYIDVHIDDTIDVDEIEIRNYYTPADIAGLNEATLRLSWWNGTDWIECSDSGATYPAGEPTYRGYVWAKIRAPGAIPPTIPTLDDMAGTAFMSMGKPPVPPPAPPPPAPEEEEEVGVGPAAPPAPPPGTTNVKGKVSSTGVFNESVTATTEDGLCTLTIPRGTVGLTEDLEPLAKITALIMDEPPLPPEDAHIVGLAYDFGPDGATFEPAISLTWSYDPADIPEGVAEEDLVIAYYDEAAGEWVELECVVDAENNTITASVSRFTTFVIIGAVTPPPVPPVPPAPPAPAGFSLSNLTVQPAEVQPNETVTIAVSVANTGGTEGSRTVVLKINGVKVEESRVTIAAGSSQIVRFSTSSEEVGRYNVTVDGLSVSFAVVAPVVAPVVPPTEPEEVEEVPAERNWPLIIISGIIAAAVVIGLVAFFLVRRRA